MSIANDLLELEQWALQLEEKLYEEQREISLSLRLFSRKLSEARVGVLRIEEKIKSLSQEL